MTRTAKRGWGGARPGAGRPRLRLSQLIAEWRFDWENPRHRRALREDYLGELDKRTLAGRSSMTVWEVDQLVQAYRLSESVGARGPASWLAQQFAMLVAGDSGQG